MIKISELTYSSVMRELNKNQKDRVSDFMKFYKEAFDAAYIDGLEDFENICLMEAIKKSGINIKKLNELS